MPSYFESAAPLDNFKNSFSVGKLKVREDLQNRCGYFLGLQVVRETAKCHNLDDMIGWPPKQFGLTVEEALLNLAR